MRNYIYRSDRKIALFYAQIPQGRFRPPLVKAGIKLGPVAAELETEKLSKPEDPEQRLYAILKRLEKKKQIGTIDHPKRFFRGACDMKLIVDGTYAYFVGYEQQTKIHLVLCCSLQHMIGYGDIENYADRRNHYMIDSSNYGFAKHLAKLLSEEQASEFEEYRRRVIKRQQEKRGALDFFTGPYNVFDAAITASRGGPCESLSTPVEFVAVTIAWGSYESKKALIGSPFYVDQLPYVAMTKW